MTKTDPSIEALRIMAGDVKSKSATPTAPAPKSGKPPEDIIYLKMDRATVRQFKMLCGREGRQQKHMAAEALNWLFQQYSLGAIADEGKRKDDDVTE